MKRTIKFDSEIGPAGALLASMKAVQQALDESDGLPAKQMVERLQEWQQLVSDLAGGVKRGADLATLYEVTQIINSSLNLTETLNVVMDLLIHLTGAERGCLMLLDEDGALQIQAARQFELGSVDSADIELSHTVVRQAVENAQPVLTTNAQFDPRFSAQESVIGYNLRSVVCVPLHVRGRVIGALYLDNRMKEGVFCEADLPMLKAFASQAAVAIENARLYTVTDRALAARVEELTTLQQIDRELNASLDLERVLELTLSWALRATRAEEGVLCVLDKEGAVQTVATSNGGSTPALPEPETVKMALRTAEPLVVGRLRILVPIRFEGQAVGLLDLRNNGGLLFQPEHAQLAGRLADHAAVAIENARLYEKVRQVNEAKTEFVSFVAHELRTPMTSIRGYADMLSREMVGNLNPQQLQFVRIINGNVTRMQILVSDLQDISRIETGKMRFEVMPTSLSVSLGNALEVTQAQIDARSQKLAVEVPEDLPKVRADPTRLTQVMINLLSNANKYTPEKGSIHVRVWANGNLVHCAVSDTGIGISPEDQARLFTKFFRSENAAVREMPGTGLGLCIVKSLVELQGGEIQVESQLGKGTTFEFTVPAVTAA
ncbi:MAG: ATP-binding protein [Anaerolineae bacterium]